MFALLTARCCRERPDSLAAMVVEREAVAREAAERAVAATGEGGEVGWVG
jgi:hypothetical protein